MGNLTLLKLATAIGVLLTAATANAQNVSLTADTADSGLVNALRAASLSVALEAEGTSAPQDYVAAARADYRRLLTALYAAGYFGGTISITLDGIEAASIAPLDAPRSISSINIVVATGPQFIFGRTDISPTTSATVLPDSFAPQQPASTEAIEQAVRIAVDDWRAQGHAKAAPSGQQITARHADHKLDASVTLAPGPRLTFGAVTIAGNQDVRSSRIAQIAGVPTGDVYSPRALELAAARLRRTGAFDSVTLTDADDIGAGQTLPVTITVTESKPRRFGFGIELSSIEGLRVSSYWMHRNFLGGAERFRVEGEVSGIGGTTGGTDYSILASLDRPAIYGPDTNLFIRAQAMRLDEPDYLIDKASVEVGATRILSEDLEVAAGIGLLAANEQTLAFSRDYSLLTMPLQATLDKRNDKTDASRGYFINAEATPFLGLNNSTAGGRLFIDARGYHSFGEDEKLTIAGRFQLGSVIGAGAADAPADYLFHSGGGGTVRGQPYQSLGFDQTSGSGTYRSGGLAFVGAQLEARYSVTDALSAVGFYDIGMISDTSDFDGTNTWHSGVGLGLRYDTGIGPIRVDIGTPATGPDAFGSAQIYIGIGQAF